MSKINQTPTQRIEKDGQEFLRVTMSGRDYDLPFKVLSGKKVAFLDISGQVSLNEAAADDIVDLLLEAGVEFDTILNPVAKSNALAHAIALRWNKAKGTDISKTVVARKNGDGNRIQAVYRSVTTPRDQVMSLTDDDAEYIRGKRILVVDDVYGGGGTTKGLMELADKAGATVAAHAVIAVEAGVQLPEGIFYLFTLPLGE
ncbi:MAG: hypothetical protein IJU42_07830 [Erysipelotrichaceae bacterium]|nr:hypothetical protein [Erysipelotrichaceae bacterium]